MLIHDAVLESLICGNTRVMASSFSMAMDNLCQLNQQTGKSGYEMQFEVSLIHVAIDVTAKILYSPLRH